MRAMIAMPLETLMSIIERAREFDSEADEQEMEGVEGQTRDLAEDLGPDNQAEASDEDISYAAAGDDEQVEGASDEDDDEEEDELDRILGSLSPEELAELLALSWIGEGEYDRTNWDEAMSVARVLPSDDIILQLAETPNLGDLIELGLAELGYERPAADLA